MCTPKLFAAMPCARQCYIIADLERSHRELFKSGLNLKKTEKWLRKKIIKFTAVLHGKNPVRPMPKIQNVRLPNWSGNLYVCLGVFSSSMRFLAAAELWGLVQQTRCSSAGSSSLTVRCAGCDCIFYLFLQHDPQEYWAYTLQVVYTYVRYSGSYCTTVYSITTKRVKK
jgi:hypothetical protein